jgi:TetR/AcrR family transcriptional regulator, fatty acid metabolism regulator protein
MAQAPAADKRRTILDAAVRVFAKRGFHACRVSDIADEAGVAYGLVYHYFRSKDEILDEVFSERWALLVAAIEEAGRLQAHPRHRPGRGGGFIIDSYHHDPDVMKVIIVEVTRAANSFGRAHLDEIRRAYELLAALIAEGQRSGDFRADLDAGFAAIWFYGAIEQLLTGWIFEALPAADTDYEEAKELGVETLCHGLACR